MIFSHWNVGTLACAANIDCSDKAFRSACLTSVPVEQASLTVPFIELGDPARQLVLVSELCHPAWRLLPVIELVTPLDDCHRAGSPSSATGSSRRAGSEPSPRSIADRVQSSKLIARISKTNDKQIAGKVPSDPGPLANQISQLTERFDNDQS
ncbi:hypothetical protein PCASD_03426 [Puccinia coronata f. sp. avenae]|uniref:Uncharacterized protein n=1 Tax=Puccinia coronata f. sp. avenae TaxID=200324 RepID=A0A2N5VF90_9BASI|nr:hypothetical protein PCASD_03426 [Puccinia coronata f. sp. avenae]